MIECQLLASFLHGSPWLPRCIGLLKLRWQLDHRHWRPYSVALIKDDLQAGVKEEWQVEFDSTCHYKSWIGVLPMRLLPLVHIL